MKKYWHIALMLFCVLMITSCGDDDEALEVDEVWKVQNEEAFQAQMLVPGFEQLSSQSNAGFILRARWNVIIKGRLLMERFLMINRLRQVPLPSLLFLRW